MAAIVITAATMAVTATVFDATQWPGYIGTNLVIAVIYALIGVVIGPVLGKVAGMLRPVPQEWAQFLPGYGLTRVLFDTSPTVNFDEIWPLLTGFAWLGVLLVVAALVLARGGRAAPGPVLASSP